MSDECDPWPRRPPTWVERVDDALIATLLVALLVPVLFVAAMLDPDDFLSAWREPA